MDVCAEALKALKKPIAWILVIFLLWGLFTISKSLVYSSVYTALSPICRIPGASYMGASFCQSDFMTKPKKQSQSGEPQFNQLMNVQSKFEEIMALSSEYVSLPQAMKRGEASVRDLRQLVRYSQLHSKNELSMELDSFVETARMASSDLQRFMSHTNRAVDIILATARWTSRSLDDISSQRQLESGVLGRFYSIMPASFGAGRSSEEKVLNQYLSYASAIEGEIITLLKEAHELQRILESLEGNLDVIQGIAGRDQDIFIGAKQDAKQDVLKALWTILGGNRKEMKRYEDNIQLLEQVKVSRQIALHHVSHTIVRLQEMQAEIEQLRETVATAETIGVPLSVHIESVKLGVERLESGRSDARQRQDEYRKLILDGKDTGQERLIDATSLGGGTRA